MLNCVLFYKKIRNKKENLKAESERNNNGKFIMAYSLYTPKYTPNTPIYTQYTQYTPYIIAQTAIIFPFVNRETMFRPNWHPMPSGAIHIWLSSTIIISSLCSQQRQQKRKKMPFLSMVYFFCIKFVSPINLNPYPILMKLFLKRNFFLLCFSFFIFIISHLSSLFFSLPLPLYPIILSVLLSFSSIENV